MSMSSYADARAFWSGVIGVGEPAVVLVGGGASDPRSRRSLTTRLRSAHLLGPMSLVGSCASIQTAAALATLVFSAFGPAGAGALRCTAAAVVLLAVARPTVRGRSRRFWVSVAAFGAAMAAMNFCLYEAIARIPLGTAVTLEFLGPLALAALGARRRVDLVWALAAGSGVVLLTGGLSGASTLGVLLAFGAAASWACYLLLSRRVGELTGGLDGLALSVSAAALITMPIGVPAAFHATTASDFLVVIGVGVLGIAIPYALELFALRQLPVRTVSTLLSLDPAIAAIAGLVFLSQHLGLGELAGIALIMGASAGATNSATHDS